MADGDLGIALLGIARSAIASELGRAARGATSHPALAQPGATFVTLKCDGELRGCIGSLEPRRALGVDVRDNALAAAFRDPRFPPLAAAELDATRVEVSLLSPREALVVADEADLVRKLRPGVDGVVLECGHHRATFLPQVWETLGEPSEFLAALKRKAGLGAEFWSARMRVSRYRVTQWSETTLPVAD